MEGIGTWCGGIVACPTSMVQSHGAQRFLTMLVMLGLQPGPWRDLDTGRSYVFTPRRRFDAQGRSAQPYRPFPDLVRGGGKDEGRSAGKQMTRWVRNIMLGRGRVLCSSLLPV